MIPEGFPGLYAVWNALFLLMFFRFRSGLGIPTRRGLYFDPPTKFALFWPYNPTLKYSRLTLEKRMKQISCGTILNYLLVYFSTSFDTFSTKSILVGIQQEIPYQIITDDDYISCGERCYQLLLCFWSIPRHSNSCNFLQCQKFFCLYTKCSNVSF